MDRCPRFVEFFVEICVTRVREQARGPLWMQKLGITKGARGATFVDLKTKDRRAPVCTWQQTQTHDGSTKSDGKLGENSYFMHPEKSPRNCPTQYYITRHNLFLQKLPILFR